MPDQQLSLEQKNRIYEISAIPVILAFFVFLAYAISLLQKNLLGTTWNFIMLWFLPFFIVEFMVGTLSFEILYHQKMKKSLAFHMRRFGMNMALAVLSVLSLVALMLFMDVTLSSLLGKYAVVLGMVLWSLMFAAIIAKFQRVFSNIWKDA
jgi:hypothetical protein